MTKSKTLFTCFCLLITSLSPNLGFASRPAENEVIPSITQNQSQEIPTAPAIQQVETRTRGDVITTPKQIQISAFDFPRRGMDMSKVLNELGEPLTRHPAVGQPPITRWDYTDRSVFFEYSHVLHVVAK